MVNEYLGIVDIGGYRYRWMQFMGCNSAAGKINQLNLNFG